ncbi:hypothetical protein [Dysgonomonas sp. 521]|uniref:hypothetical protein n=1 Tax=Dysgonomonas sp. 521 TaxID=2302932 RepID=UPI0013D16D30|nr:hypothetical protein [Dysgonomonas sp. 521]
MSTEYPVLDNETKEEMPKLIRQDFFAPRVICIVLQLILVSIVLTLFLFHLFELFLFLIALHAVLFSWLLRIFNKYLDNFEHQDCLQEDIKYFSIGVFSMIFEIPIAFLAYYLSDSAPAASFFLVIIIPFINFLLFYSVNQQLYDFEDDYVGGIDEMGFDYNMGQFLITTIFFPVNLPIAIFNVFNKASKYAKIHGFTETQ